MFVVHLKTRLSGGQAGHGYPDDTSFARNYEELEKNGVTLADLDARWPWFKDTEFGRKALAKDYVQEMEPAQGGGGGAAGAGGAGGGKRQKKK